MTKKQLNTNSCPVSLIELLFKNRKPNVQRLVSFGFMEQDGNYTHMTDVADGQFKMTVTVAKAGNVSATLTESASGEEYVLHRVPGAKGAFIGKVREEYEGILNAIAANCFDPDVFKSDYAVKVIRHVREKYGDEPEFLWQRFSGNAIFRRKDTAKWYGALLVLSKQKLGLDSDDVIDILDLRIKPEDVAATVDGCRYFPGYHMNKKHWYTICLDGSVSLEEIYRLIDDSYALAG